MSKKTTQNTQPINPMEALLKKKAAPPIKKGNEIEAKIISLPGKG